MSEGAKGPRKLRRGPPPNTVEMYSIGWTRRGTYSILFAWVTAWVTAFVVALVVTFANMSVERAEAWMVGIGAVTFLPFIVVFYAGRNVKARRPFVTVTQHGATPRNSDLIRWDAILRIYVSGDPLQRDLYIELRDPRHVRQGMDRFLLLHDGTELSKFLVVASDDEARTITGADLAEELDDLHLAYAAAGSLGAQEATPPGAVPGKEELVIPQAVSDRWATGIIGAVGAAGAVAVTAIVGWVLFPAKGDDSIAIGALVAMVVVAVVAIVFFRGGVRILAQSLGGRPLLIVDRSGLTHVTFGFIPWSEITSIQVDELGGDDAKPVACAYVTESYYRRRLNGRGFERLGLALRNVSWRFQLVPRLPLIWGSSDYSRKGYVRNGLAMPPVTVEELARLIRGFPRESSNRATGDV